ncbi:MAG TPA: cysteine desulfurase family protein [Spirochaetia bacterium]|nr:cysteine desulfurase family protein [Spirochaetia bacterium]
MSRTYLDWAATAPPSPEALEEYLRAAREYPGNPSSLHAEGSAARTALEDARARLAGLLGCRPGRVVFTSGGTEADGLPLLALLRRPSPGSVVISSIEHPAVFEQAAVLERLGWKVRRVDPGPDGRVAPGAVVDACGPDTVLAAVMAVNNETGAVQPLSEIRLALDEASRGGRRIRFHTDAVQAFGKVPFEPESLGADSAALSAHKIRGPRGVGALYLRTPIEPLAAGGGQEGGIRSGTENLAGILAFERAAAAAIRDLGENRRRARVLSDRLLDHIRAIPDVRPVPECRKAGDERYSPWILGLSLPGLAGETAVRILSDAGYDVSTGSACSSSRRKRRVLEAMGVPEALAFCAIRVSLGPTTTESEIDGFAEALRDAYLRYRT